MLDKLSVLEHPTNLDNSSARAYCGCSRCGYGLYGLFFSSLSFFFLPLWERARYGMKYCLKRAVKPKTTSATNQPYDSDTILVHDIAAVLMRL